eukprot:TRINITY_DN9851_c0_g1_i2.p1 TRINITY_DN9851_c0_g1~~TRINITY_DN9851_c0_g1_i2.p1  ORF type:complete len:401 (-),score=83.11 TRINITY_DN9851_c0_g1_i2:43-1245(-)
MNELAGGFYKGDRVVCHGRTGTVFGKPARAACVRISVAVMYDDGQMVDERVSGLNFLQDEPEPGELEPRETQELPVYTQEPPEPQSLPPMGGRPPVPQIQGMGRREDPEMEGRYDSQQGYGMPSQPEYQMQPIDGGKGDDYDEDDDDYSPEVEVDSPQGPPMGATQMPFRQGGNLFDQPPAAEAARAAEVEQMVDAVLHKIRLNYRNLRMAFRALDRSNNGYVSRADFFDAMEHIFLSAGHSPEDVDAVAEVFQLGRGETLSYDEFCQIVGASEEDAFHQGADGLDLHEDDIEKEDRSERARIEKVDMAIQAFKQTVDRRYDSMRTAFRALDKSRTSSLNPSEFALGLSMHGVQLSANELQDAWDIFDPNQKGQISYADFCRVMSQRHQFGKHLRRQMYK